MIASPVCCYSICIQTLFHSSSVIVYIFILSDSAEQRVTVSMDLGEPEHFLVRMGGC